MKSGIIDRYEGDLAIIEIEGSEAQYPKSALPPTAKIGDLVVIEGDVIRIDVDATAKRKVEIGKLMDELFESR